MQNWDLVPFGRFRGHFGLLHSCESIFFRDRTDPEAVARTDPQAVARTDPCVADRKDRTDPDRTYPAAAPAICTETLRAERVEGTIWIPQRV